MDMYYELLKIGLSEKLAYEICIFCQKHNITLLEWFYFSNMTNYFYSNDYDDFEMCLALSKKSVEESESFLITDDDYD